MVLPLAIPNLAQCILISIHSVRQLENLLLTYLGVRPNSRVSKVICVLPVANSFSRDWHFPWPWIYNYISYHMPLTASYNSKTCSYKDFYRLLKSNKHLVMRSRKAIFDCMKQAHNISRFLHKLVASMNYDYNSTLRLAKEIRLAGWPNTKINNHMGTARKLYSQNVSEGKKIQN